MLSVQIQKDVCEYKPKIVGQLTARSLFCSVAAILVSVLAGCYFYFILGLGYDFAMYAIIVLSIPLWAAGFWHPHGMNLEQFVPLWFKHKMGKNIVYYVSANLTNSEMNTISGPRKLAEEFAEKNKGQKVSKNYKVLCKRPDFEAYEASKNFEG